MTLAEIAPRCAAESELRSACTSTVLPPRISTVGWVSPAASTALVTFDWETPETAISHELPPLKSMPKLKPRMEKETKPATMIVAEMRNHQRLRPTKSKLVWPR